MLERLEIRNFRSCNEVVIDNLPGIVALVGKNGAGKTNILKAIEWAAQIATSLNPHSIIWNEFVDLFSIRRFPNIQMDIRLGEALYSYKIALAHPDGGTGFNFEENVTLQSDEGKKTLCERKGSQATVLDIKEPLSLGLMVSALPYIESLFGELSSIGGTIKPLLGFFRHVRYYPLIEPSDLTAFQSNAFIREEDYSAWLANYKQSGDFGNYVLLKLIHMHENDKPTFDELNALIGVEGLNLIHSVQVTKTIAFSPPGPPFTLYHVRFHHADENGPTSRGFPYHYLSSGTRRILNMITSLIFDDSSVMLMEHPEDGIHDGLLTKLLDLLRENKGQSQIIMSTHSLNVLNRLQPEELRFVDIHEAHTRVHKLEPKNVDLAKRFIEEDGGNLSEFVESMEDSE